MSRRRQAPVLSPRRALLIISAILWPLALPAADILRASRPTPAKDAAESAAPATVTPAAGLSLLSSQDRLARTAQSLSAIRQMQQSARDLAKSATTGLKPGLAAVPANSFGVANGLVANSARWSGAKLPAVASQADGSSNVTVVQTQQQALLNWDSFNIGRDTTLTFDQGQGGANAGQWIAFNFVRDPSGSPTQILGRIKTIGLPDAKGVEQVGGQVYVMNANGIIFGGSSQVNVHALVASSLPLNANLVARGLLVQSAQDAQFQFSGLPTTTFDPGVATTLTPVQTTYAGAAYGNVEVQAGAQLVAPTNSDHVGGKIALIAPNVSNAGTINTDDGQTILAAGLQVGLATHRSSDPTLRGLDVFVGAVSTPAANAAPIDGVVTNTGLIESHRSSIYLTGREVAQNGVVATTTSVAYNGRVDIVAGYNALANPVYDPSAANGSAPFFYQSNVDSLATGALVANSGAVTLGAGSLIRLLPEAESAERVTGDLNLPSQVNLQGRSVELRGNAAIIAPGASTPVLAPAYGADGLAFAAGVNLRAGTWFNTILSTSVVGAFAHSADNQQIYLTSGAVIDASGLTSAEITALGGKLPSVSENVISVELRGSELADSPLQRDGPLRGQTVTVDLRRHGPWDPTLNKGQGGYTWVGTPLGDTAGWVGLTTHTVAQLSIDGGSVALAAGGAVVVEKGAQVDVSAGAIDYLGGNIQTTKLESDGHIYDISAATSDRKYTGVFSSTVTRTDSKWGVETTTMNPLARGSYEEGYRQGGNGGVLAISGPELALDGDLLGQTAAGSQQRVIAPTYVSGTGLVKAPLVPDWLVNLNSLPAPARMEISIGRQEFAADLAIPDYIDRSPTPATVYVSNTPLSYQSGAATTPVFLDTTFGAARGYEVDLHPDWFGSGKFGGLTLANAGDDVPLTVNPAVSTVERGTAFGSLIMPSGGTLDLGTGGFFVAQAANITLGANSTIRATGGTIDLAAYNVSTSVADLIRARFASGSSGLFPDYDPDRGNVVLSSGAKLDTAGAVVAATRDGTAALIPAVTNGGAVKIQGNQVDLKAGSVIDVSGGVVVSATGNFNYGSAGAVTLAAGRSYFSGNVLAPLPIGGSLQLGGTLKGYAGVGKSGGALALTAPAIAVSVPAAAGGSTTSTSATGGLNLSPGFFDLGGFSSFSLTGLGLAFDETGAFSVDDVPEYAVSIGKNAVIAPQVLNWKTLPGGAVFRADARRQAPVKLALVSKGRLSGIDGTTLLGNATGIVVAAGAKLQAQDGATAAGSIRIDAGSGGTVDILGQLVAQAGQISLSAQGLSGESTPNVHLAPTAVLDASGTTRWSVDPTGSDRRDAAGDLLVKSSVTAGGTVSLSGSVVVESGATVTVAGTSDTVQLLAGDYVTGVGQKSALAEAVVDSNGGTVNLVSEGLLLVAPTALHGGAGGTNGQGGTLNVSAAAPRVSSSDPANVPGLTDPGLRLVASTPGFKYNGFDRPVVSAATGRSFLLDPVKLTGQALLGADTFVSGGFGALSLQSDIAIEAAESVTFTAAQKIQVTGAGVLAVRDGAALALRAPYVSLGQEFLKPGETSTALTAATSGTGSVTVQASSLIDVGNLVVRGAKTVTLDATAAGTAPGSIRGDGTLLVGGDLTLRAAQVYPPTATTFNVIAAGALTVKSSGLAAPVALPLSAGGSLNLYATTIEQGGVLRAPLGSIHLGAGADATGATTITDPLSNTLVPVTKSLHLVTGSVTSVAAIDPVTNKPVKIPYGVNLDGEAWVAPDGTDITNTGPLATAKTIAVEAFQSGTDATGIQMDAGAKLDLSGGGDLFAYRFVPGTGGKTDLLNPAEDSFAILPGYADQYSPYAPNNSSSVAQETLRNDRGYVLPAGYAFGDRIHLAGGGGLPAGDYTILPARYALLPGAYLVAPGSGATTVRAAANRALPLGSTLMSGYTYNSFDAHGQEQPVFLSFEVSPAAVVAKRAEYDTFGGNSFFATAAIRNEETIPRGGFDAGSLTLAVQAAPHLPARLDLEGTIAMTPWTPADASGGGRLGAVDLTTTSAIRIGGVRNPGSDELWLDPTQLNGLGSVLVGGVRQAGMDETTLRVTTASITVDAGTVLSDPELILASTGKITIADKASLTATAATGFVADELSVTGNGALVRVTADPAAVTTRLASVDSLGAALPFTQGELAVGTVTFSGASVGLDAALRTTILPGATLGDAQSHVSLSSGRIALQFSDQVGAPADALVLGGPTLNSLGGVAGLSLISYSTIDFLGDGTLGLGANGARSLKSLALQGTALRGIGATTAGVTLAAQDVTLSGATSGLAPVFTDPVAGALKVDAETIHLGEHEVALQGFATGALSASRAVSLEGTATAPGTLRVTGASLQVTTPLIVGAAAANQSIVTEKDLSVVAPTGAATGTAPIPGLGANLALIGKTVTVATAIKLPSGRIDAQATGGAVTVTGTLDVGGVVQSFFDTTRSTDAGIIGLRAEAGDVDVSGGRLNLSRFADSIGTWTGNAGTLAVAAPAGKFLLSGATLSGAAGTGALGGAFRLEAKTIDANSSGTSNVAALHTVLAAAGFDRDVGFEVRQGDLVADTDFRAHHYALTADHGSVTVNAAIDASGLAKADDSDHAAVDPTGGSIALSASGNVNLGANAALNVAGYNYDNAGKGGSILLAAGSYTVDPVTNTGTADPAAKVTIDPGARLNLGVAHAFTTEDLVRATVPGEKDPLAAATALALQRVGAGGLVTGTLHVRQTQAALGSGAQYLPLASQATGASAIALEGFQVFDVTATNGLIATNGAITSVGSGGLIDTTVTREVQGNGNTFVAGGDGAILGNALFHFQPGAEIVNRTPVAETSTNRLLTFYSSATGSRSLVNFTLQPGNTVVTTIPVPGGLPTGVTLTIATAGRRYTVTTADGVTTAPVNSVTGTVITSASAANPVVAVNFINTGGTALATQLSFGSGATPFSLAMGAAASITSFNFAANTAVRAGDLTLANTWDLSALRFGARAEPGFLALRARGDLVFTFDASLSDGFDPTRAVNATYPLLTAPLLAAGKTSWSYGLVAGADYTSAAPAKVAALASLSAGRGSVLIGRGGIALPVNGSATTPLTISATVPQYYQTIRTGTGDITVAAGRDVQLLNPLATLYTAGVTAQSLAGFDVPVLNSTRAPFNAQSLYYTAQYAQLGGNLAVSAQRDIARYRQTFDTSGLVLTTVAASAKEMPTNWLYRRGLVGANGNFATVGIIPALREVQSTSWWVDYSNFFSDFGALGGGNLSLQAGRDVLNVNAAVPSNARMPGYVGDPLVSKTPIAPDLAKLVELGGGNLAITAGRNVDGGVYYAERGSLDLTAGAAVKTNATRYALLGVAPAVTDDVTLLPTTLFLGKGRASVSAGSDVLLGSVANPFWFPQAAKNRNYDITFFSTLDQTSTLSVVTLGGDLSLRANPAADPGTAGSLAAWYGNVLGNGAALTTPAQSQPWLALLTANGPAQIGDSLRTVSSLLPATVAASAFSGDVNLAGSLVLSPSNRGNLEIFSAGAINGLVPNGLDGWATAAITISDASPLAIPSPVNPIAFTTYQTSIFPADNLPTLKMVEDLFAETGSTGLSLARKTTLHASIDGKPLHWGDAAPARLYAAGGDISGLTLYSAKSARLAADHDITDVALYLQNVQAGDVSVVAAGRDVVPYNPNSLLRKQAADALLISGSGVTGVASPDPNAGDIQVSGPGRLDVIAGRDITLGTGAIATTDLPAAGITSVGLARNPALPQGTGSSLTVVAGVGAIYAPGLPAGQPLGLASTKMDFQKFIGVVLDPATAGTLATRYLPVLATELGLEDTDPAAIWTAFSYVAGRPLTEQKAAALVAVFSRVLRDAARDRNNPESPTFGKYTNGFAAIAALFPGSPEPTEEDLKSTVAVVRPAGPWSGRIALPTHLIKTSEGGAVTLLAPGGDITVGRSADPQKPDQGVLTERGGGISIFAADSINVGTSRIFTLRGGNETIWSTWGDIAAGSGSKTVFSAPPTRVLIDPQSGDVQNDLAGLATGSGIGVLATLEGVKPGDIDLIAPVGTVDAGDAGIRASGNLNVAARVVLNAANIKVGGLSVGTPPPPSAPNVAPIAAASAASAAAASAADGVAKRSAPPAQAIELPSLFSVEVLGYGGGEGDEDDDKKPGNGSNS